MNADRQEKLTQEEREKYNIKDNSLAYRFYLDKVIEERCDEFDYILESEGFEILNQEMIRIATSIYNYEVTVTKPLTLDGLE